MVKMALAKTFMDSYQSKNISKSVNDLMETYNEVSLLVSCFDLQLLHRDDMSEVSRKSNKVSDTVFDNCSALEMNLKFIENFERTINKVQNMFTEDEMLIFEYSVEKQEKDAVVQEVIRRYDKPYYNIKKSCYLKIYLTFGLNDKDSYYSKMIKRLK